MLPTYKGNPGLTDLPVTAGVWLTTSVRVNRLHVFFSFLLIHEGLHRKSNQVMTSSAGGAKGCSDHRIRASLAGYTAAA